VVAFGEMTPSVTICLPHASDKNGHDTNLRRAHELAALILHESNPHFDNWNKVNFFHRLEKLTPERAAILILPLRSEPHDGLVIDLSSFSTIRLVDLMAHIGVEGRPPAFLFLFAGQGIDPASINSAISPRNNAIFIVWVPKSLCAELVALGCEFSRWWGLHSLLHEDVPFSYMASRLEVFLHQLNPLMQDGKFECINNMRRNSAAWHAGKILVSGVDYETFTANVRSEHLADSLKRLADAAYAPRARYRTPEQNLVSSQALFWFTELQPDKVDFDWFRSSRFGFELFGSDVAGRAPSVSFADTAFLEPELIREFLSHFLRVPAGRYWIGSKEDFVRSEPPAALTEIFQPQFMILRRPVIGRDWRLFSATVLTGMSDELPVTHCDAFQAFLFADAVGRAFSKFGLSTDAAKVNLPTEQQWEIAASGSNHLDFPWGESFEIGRCNCDLAYGRSPTKPGQFSPLGDSPFGCQDMSGNVREWTRSYGGVSNVDWQYYSEGARTRALTSLRPADRLVIRGGSYSYEADCVRTWVRNTQLAERSDQQTGFRLVLESK
jgi:formylglycine-generating enzyme required for sulfatase activity